MPSTIVLNQSNLLNDGNNNTFIYRFPNSVAFPHHEIAIQNITMYYSWSNINSATLQNNIFQYTWDAGGVLTTYTITIPDGLYEVVDLNYYLQFQFIKNGTYLINDSGQYVYYAQFVVNPNRYAVQINTFPVPIALPLNWSVPVANPATGDAGWVGFPLITFNPQIILPANFNQILGYSVGFTTALNAGAGTNLSYLSSTAPQVQPNSSVYLAISNIANKYAIPNSIIYSVSPKVGFGEQISDTPPQFAWNKLLSGTYNELRFQILGINYQPIEILDPNMTIIMVIRDMKDLGFQELMNISSGGK